MFQSISYEKRRRVVLKIEDKLLAKIVSIPVMFTVNKGNRSEQHAERA